MQQFENPAFYLEHSHHLNVIPPAAARQPHGDLPHELVLALQHALLPPILFGQNRLERMRVIVIQPGHMTTQEMPADMRVRGSGHANSHANGHSPQVLPPVAAITRQTGMPPLSQRAVQGEILSDEAGKLYEKIGRQIRPLHQLVSGPYGEVIDVLPSVNTPSSKTVGETFTPPPDAVEPPPLQRETPRRHLYRSKKTNRIEEASGLKAPVNNSNVSQTSAARSSRTENTTCRKLLPDPGQWRVVYWGEFKELLASQLAHPERLRDSYRMPCYVQVFETLIPQRIETFRATIARQEKISSPLFPLTDETAARLELTNLLTPPRRTQPAPTQPAREHELLSPHARFFCLLVVNDPTVDVAVVRGAKSTPAGKTAATAQENGAVKKENEKSASELKKEIPERFMQTWNFVLSREEALYDLNQQNSLGQRLSRLYLRWRWSFKRRELRKWQVLLSGKDGDEQLWSIHPPQKKAYGIPEIRRWAQHTLASAGYDAEAMLPEWETYWRRKGF